MISLIQSGRQNSMVIFNEIILTHCGKLGDMLYSLMVGSWLYKNYQRKIHWLLPEGFGPFRYISNLLMAQEQTLQVTLVPHKIENFGCGGQPYKFDPATFGIEGEYFNLGFRHSPNKFIAAFYAEEYGLGYDADFELGFGQEMMDVPYSDGKIWRSSELAMQMLMPEIESLPNSIDLLELALMMASAEKLHTWYNGIAVLCWLANIPSYVYRVKGHAPMELYFPKPRNLIFNQLEVHPKDMVGK